MNGDHEEFESNHSPHGEIRHGVRQLSRDVVTLVELQTELLRVDFAKFVRSCVTPAVIGGAVALVAALASLPLMLLSLAYYLAEVANLTLASSLLAAAGVGILIAVIAAAIAWSAARRGRGAFQRFGSELGRNVNWLKQVLGSPLETAESLTPEAAYRPPR